MMLMMIVFVNFLLISSNFTCVISIFSNPHGNCRTLEKGTFPRVVVSKRSYTCKHYKILQLTNRDIVNLNLFIVKSYIHVKWCGISKKRNALQVKERQNTNVSNKGKVYCSLLLSVTSLDRDVCHQVASCYRPDHHKNGIRITVNVNKELVLLIVARLQPS